VKFQVRPEVVDGRVILSVLSQRHKLNLVAYFLAMDISLAAVIPAKHSGLHDCSHFATNILPELALPLRTLSSAPVRQY
jgi:hypothetical protein